MKIQISKGSTNFTLEFESNELNDVAKNIGSIMMSTFAQEGVQKTIEFETLNANISEEEAYEKALNPKRPSRELKELTRAEELRLAAQAKADEEEMNRERARLQAAADKVALETAIEIEEARKLQEETERKEAEAKAKMEEVKAKLAELKENYDKASASLSAMIVRMDNETDEDVKALLSNKVAVLQENVNSINNEITATMQELPYQAFTPIAPAETIPAKTSTSPVENTTSTPAENPASEEDDVRKKGLAIIDLQKTGKTTTKVMVKSLMELFSGSKVDNLIQVMKTFPEKKPFWGIIGLNKQVLEATTGFTKAELKEFLERTKK